jgi:hypothetical protein
MAQRDRTEFGNRIEYGVVDTGINGSAFMTHPTTLTSSILLVSGMWGFSVSAVFASAGATATTGGFTMKMDAYAADGTKVISDHLLGTASSLPSNGTSYVLSWIEGDIGAGINMTNIACKPLVGLYRIALKLVTTASFDEGPFTVKLFVAGVR